MIDFLQEHPINCAVLKERKWNEDRELRRAAKKDTRNFGFHLRVSLGSSAAAPRQKSFR